MIPFQIRLTVFSCFALFQSEGRLEVVKVPIDDNSVIGYPCDILSPCALGNVSRFHFFLSFFIFLKIFIILLLHIYLYFMLLFLFDFNSFCVLKYISFQLTFILLVIIFIFSFLFYKILFIMITKYHSQLPLLYFQNITKKFVESIWHFLRATLILEGSE